MSDTRSQFFLLTKKFTQETLEGFYAKRTPLILARNEILNKSYPLQLLSRRKLIDIDQRLDIIETEIQKWRHMQSLLIWLGSNETTDSGDKV